MASKKFLGVDNRELTQYCKSFALLKNNTKKDIKEIIRDAARHFLVDVKNRTPQVSGELRRHWDTDNLDFVVRSTDKGYYVELVNKCEYASYVESGHFSYNQFGGPYEVKNRTVPFYYKPSGKTVVYGVFFLKKTEVEYASKGKLDHLVSLKAEQWLQSYIEKYKN